VVLPDETSAVGNVAMQALALGHITSMEQAGDIVRRALKTQTIHPHASAWTDAYDRFLALNPA